MRDLDDDDGSVDGRTIALLASIQLTLLMLGWSAVAIVLRLHDYPDHPNIRWNPIAVWSREHGWVFVLVILAWALAAVASIGIQAQENWSLFIGVAGILLIALILALFGYSAVNPGAQPLLSSRSSQTLPYSVESQVSRH